MLVRLLFIWVSVMLPFNVWAQDTIPQNLERKGPVKAASKLSKSLQESRSNDEVAADYMALALELVAQKEYSKAENNYLRAVELYDKSKNKEALSAAYRELAKTQEAMGKFEQAIINYNNADKNSKDKQNKEINANDAKRLGNRANPRMQSQYIQKNIELSEQLNNKKEASNAYRQMAQVKIEMDDKEGAINDLQNALMNVKDEPMEAIQIQQEIADAYIAEEEYEKAIDVSTSSVQEARKMQDSKMEIQQLKSLSNSYMEANKKDEAVSSLKEAYGLALSSGNTMEARNSLKLLTEQYRKEKKTDKALAAYDDFLNKLDTLILSDSSLINTHVFQSHEERISQLEKERALKDKLISRKNTFNYVLLISISLILISMLFIARALYAINKKNKKIALQSLRREMNPHFIFNSLNSVNQFIAQNNELEANKYLSSYSKLMRNMMENSNKDFISLTTEIEQLKEYLDLEHMRFHDKFTYQILIDDSLDTDAIYVPNMLIQPQLENAIWHGLRYKEGSGILLLNIAKEKEALIVYVEDNGIGLQKSQELKTKHQKRHNSRGLTNTKERIRLLNELYGIYISIDISEKQGAETGVIVRLNFPFIDKKTKADEYLTEDKKRNS